MVQLQFQPAFFFSVSLSVFSFPLFRAFSSNSFFYHRGVGFSYVEKGAYVYERGGVRLLARSLAGSKE